MDKIKYTNFKYIDSSVKWANENILPEDIIAILPQGRFGEGFILVYKNKQ